MNRKLPLLMLGIAAITSSCGNDGAINPEPQIRTITMNAALDSDAGSRADGNTENKNITRYILEVYVNGSSTKDATLSGSSSNGTFTLKLDIEKSYELYCWADEGSSAAYDIDNGLSHISLKSGQIPTIAHQGRYSIPANTFQEPTITMPLTHAVAKVALQTTTPLATNSARADIITYSAYDAITQKVIGSAVALTGPVGPAAAITTASDTNPAGIIEFYTLVSNETCGVTIHYTATPDDFSDTYTRTIDNVPVKADHRTILVGNIAGLQYNITSITAKLADSWTSIGNEVPITGSGTTTTEPTNPDDPKGPSNPDDPADEYAVISIDGKTSEQVKTEVASAISAGQTNIRLTGTVSDGLFGMGSPFDNTTTYSNIDISQTTGWNALSYTLPEQTFYWIEANHIILPSEIKTIGKSAFSKSTIISISLPDVTTLSQNCFQGCSKLTEINAPEVTEIQSGAFSNCKNIKTLKLTAGNINLDNNAFSTGTTSNIDLWLKSSEKSKINTTAKTWHDWPWNSITLVDNNGSVTENFQ